MSTVGNASQSVSSDDVTGLCDHTSVLKRPVTPADIVKALESNIAHTKLREKKHISRRYSVPGGLKWKNTPERVW